MSNRPPLIPALALCIVATSFAGTGCFIREFGIAFSAPAWLLTQASAGAACLLPALRCEALPARDLLLLALRGLFGWCLGGYFFFEAVRHGSIGNAAALSALPWGTLWAVLVYRERFSWHLLATIMTASIGVLLLTNVSFVLTPASLEAILSGLLISLAQTMRPLHSPTMRDSQLACLGNLLASILLFTWVCTTGETTSWILSLSKLRWEACAILLLQQGLNALLLNYAFGRVAPSVGSIILTLEVALGITLGAVFYHESILLIQIIGAILIMGSVILSAMLPRTSGAIV